MKWWRQPRKPMVGLLLCAGIGIFAADRNPMEPLAPALLLMALAVITLWKRPNVAAHLFVAGVFFLLHDFQLLDSPGKRLAEKFSGTPIEVTVTGVVVSEPQVSETARGLPLARFRLQLDSIDAGEGEHAENAVVMATWRGDAPAYGERVSIVGEAVNIAPPRNPGEFDYRNYAKRLGVWSEVGMRYPNDGESLGTGYGNPIVAAAIASRKWMQEKLRLGIDDSPDAAGLIQGMVLGRKNEAPEETRELFQRTGTLHLFVVNGLHIGMFSTVIILLMSLLGVRRRLCAAILIPLVFYYALLTGMSPGSIRAAIMATIVLGGQLLERKPITVNNFAAAGVVILLWDTNELFMPGFQFSFGVVFAILIFTPPLQSFLVKFGTPDPFIPRPLWTSTQKVTHAAWRKVSELLGVSTAACAGSLPFTAMYYHLISPSAIVSNLVIVPAAFFVLACGLASITGAFFSDSAAAFFNVVNKWIAKGILCAVYWLAQIPAGHIYVAPPQLASPACEINVLDLSAGSAIYIRSGGKDWLVDCGNAYTYKNTVSSFLRSRGVNHLDGFIMSNGGASFTGADDTLKSDFSPHVSTASPGGGTRNLQNAEAHPVRDQIFPISSSAKIRILYPPDGLKARSIADKALVLQLECNGHRVLIMPGSSATTTQWLVQNEHDLQCDFLIEGLRAADVAENLAFVDAVHPKAILCLSPQFPKAYHIDETWIDEVTKRGIQLFKQDQTGAVTIELNRDAITARAFLNDQRFFSKSR